MQIVFKYLLNIICGNNGPGSGWRRKRHVPLLFYHLEEEQRRSMKMSRKYFYYKLTYQIIEYKSILQDNGRFF